MSDKRNGLYYESMGIRNRVLSRNIGEYWSYKHSLLENGGLAIGMPYAVETELTPITLADRSVDGLHLSIMTGRYPNPQYNLAWRQGGLFGYTHEVINPGFDWIHRNQNLLESYFDYASTEDVQNRLDTFPSSLPWGRNGFLNGNDTGGLRAYSSYDDPQNAEYYNDYTEFIRSIFTGGMSFDKHLGENYITNLLYDGFSKDFVDTGAVEFIDDKAGFITDDIDTVLKPIADTELGYIGRILLGEEKQRQITYFEGKRYQKNINGYYEHRPITDDPELILGLGTGNEDDYRVGISAYNPPKTEGMRFIKDVDEVLGGDLEIKKESFQDDILRKHLNTNVNNGWYANIIELGEYLGYTRLDNPGEMSVESHLMFEGREFDTYEGTESQHGDNLSVRTYSEYDERDEEGGSVRNHFNGTRYGEHNITGIDDVGEKNLLARTRQLFSEHKIKTLVGRFHTSEDDPESKRVSLTQSAVDKTFGMSHGRNLLKLNPTYENDYNNPYCRVWTYHHQYAKMTDLIRPFSDGDKFMDLDALQENYPGRPILRNPGRQSWAQKTVLNRNGMVNIAPTRKIGHDDLDRVKAKQCMLSIENLAWKNVHNSNYDILDEGEIGPLGGRIMWFPPYNLQFNESINVSWGSNDFIGRGEKIYSYTNTDRTGTLSFTILADHPSILDYWLNTDNRRNAQGKEKEANDQTVLRFFAGCENLEAEDQVENEANGITNDYFAIKDSQKNTPKDQNDETTPNPGDNTNEEKKPGPPEEFTKDNSISFYVYYPNNLSGIDFISNPKVIVNYLVNGQNGFEFNPDLNGNPNTHVLPSDSISVNKWVDNIIIDTSGPGYEMGRSGTGLTDSETQTDIRSYNGNRANDNGRSYIWGYGIDKIYVKQRLCGPHGAKGDKTMKLYIPNYYDNTDYGLNNKPNEYDESCGYSFMDVVEAISRDYNYSGKGNASRVAKIKEILGINADAPVKNGKGRKYFFGISGGASVHGYQSSNTDLSSRRARFLKTWLEYCFEKNNLTVDYNEEAKIQIQTGIEGGEDALDVNSMSAKRGRYAKAVIYWNDEDVTDATETDNTYKETPEGETNNVVKIQSVEMKTNDVTQEEAAESTTYNDVVALTNMASTRYRDEERFFDMLKESDPVLYKHITDKVKYFDPVYHSITPEGFNRRLSFLQQCTRQGPTMSSSDLKNNRGFEGAGYAGNLSFGRAPVCVLRLGDFFNTRIIINSVQIQYETSQWDLNPEGIGVQPMLANVTISFIFQGGSSLGGPIQRLQNAVSFNYYANQEVYDDRADVAVYKDNGELDTDSSLIWIPGYGNMNLGKVNTAIEAKAGLEDPNTTTVERINEEKFSVLHQQQMEGKKMGESIIEEQSTSGVTN